MQRFRIVILVGLVLAGSSRAQPPVEDMELPKPTPLIQQPTESPTVAVSETIPASVQVPSTLMESAPVSNDWRFWASADYAVAFINGKTLPPLATTSPNGTPQASAGVPGSQVLIGGTPIPDAARSMGKFDFGVYIDQEHKYSVAAGFFVAETKGNSFSASSNGSTILARPYFEASTLAPTSLLVAFPGVTLGGSVNVQLESKTFWGSYFDVRELVIEEPWVRLESLIGYRYLHYADSISMTQVLLPVPPFTPGTRATYFDSFQAKNDFNGLEFGFLSEFICYERWSLELLAKMSAGYIRREVTINGNTQVSVPGTPTQSIAGGVYALSSNIGNHFTDDWVVAPEIDLNLGYQLTSNVRLHVGYSFIFLQDIARAADQIDFAINSNLLPSIPPGPSGPPNSPASNFGRSSLWMQSINFGVEVRF